MLNSSAKKHSGYVVEVRVVDNCGNESRKKGRIFIDKDSGITVDDCENVTRAVDKPLDDLDPIEQNYILEVSSPGIERELLKPAHFDAFLGAKVMLRLIRPDSSGQRDIKGTLTAHDKDTVTVMTDGVESVINKKDTVYIKLDDFEL